MRIKLKFSRSFLVLASNNTTALISNVRCNISIESQCHIEILCQFFFPAISRSMVHERTNQPTNREKKHIHFCYNLWLCVQTKQRIGSIRCVKWLSIALSFPLFWARPSPLPLSSSLTPIVFDRNVQFIKMEYWLTVTDLNRPYCNSLHDVPVYMLLAWLYAIDYVCSLHSFFSFF